MYLVACKVYAVVVYVFNRWRKSRHVWYALALIFWRIRIELSRRGGRAAVSRQPVTDDGEPFAQRLYNGFIVTDVESRASSKFVKLFFPVFDPKLYIHASTPYVRNVKPGTEDAQLLRTVTVTGTSNYCFRGRVAATSISVPLAAPCTLPPVRFSIVV